MQAFIGNFEHHKSIQQTNLNIRDRKSSGLKMNTFAEVQWSPPTSNNKLKFKKKLTLIK